MPFVGRVTGHRDLVEALSDTLDQYESSMSRKNDIGNLNDVNEGEGDGPNGGQNRANASDMTYDDGTPRRPIAERLVPLMHGIQEHNVPYEQRHGGEWKRLCEESLDNVLMMIHERMQADRRRRAECGADGSYVADEFTDVHDEDTSEGNDDGNDRPIS